MAWRPFRNFGLKIMALVLGTLLWATVSGQYQGERVVTVPFFYVNLPASLEITGDPPDVASVRLRGAADKVNSAEASSPHIYVDLGGSEAGRRVIPLRTDQVVVPFGVEV